jgi:drug/metabolite transporter (DMT)-like permease
MVGVALVQQSPGGADAAAGAAAAHAAAEHAAEHAAAAPATAPAPRGVPPPYAAEPPAALSYTGGVAATLLMCACSGFAAVYTECVLKRLRLHTQVCNAFMSAYGAAFAAVGALLADGGRIAQAGFFQGWTPSVYAVVAISAAGGLLVAFFLRYLDSILKNFASTCAIVLSTAASVPLFGFALSTQWALGAAVVLAAIALYNEGDVEDPPPLPRPPLGLLSAFMDAASANDHKGASAGERGGGASLLPLTGAPGPSPRMPRGGAHAA